MFWELGLTCVFPARLRQSSGSGKNMSQADLNNKNKNKNKNLEHNKAWLLAESGGCGAELTNAEPQSVHSSFRFKFCSQVELESLNMNSLNAATVLMVNLDNGMTESGAREQLKWRRMTESLERSISPVAMANALIRFTYAEILSATNNFSKGTYFFFNGFLLFESNLVLFLSLNEILIYFDF
jgi:hypothetical protein